ncbi:hypothetical protein LEP1GSC074_1157 [Leptospira noguchii str. Hook]|uniref:Uncharacterized protein n=1 Tax=Leptospira noguchii serovar Autumnalis str. ZUN142 TaxID=1085540 RepID=M6UFC8_9LEPT|nr:hypothetical protein LEP1GSC186_1298 [Leptospira noguchii serovar Autumnalis str. ZUN142]EMS82153.1 hypothetical protein LEP1GSC074_1157 [Leptospira noguchii str. Hook]
MKNSEGIGAKRTQHNAFLWVALWVAKPILAMKFASDSPKLSYTEFTLI